MKYIPKFQNGTSKNKINLEKLNVLLDQSDPLETNPLNSSGSLMFNQDALNVSIGRAVSPKISVNDTRKIRKTTGLPIDPNRDLISNDYSEYDIHKLLDVAKQKGLNKEDAWNVITIGLQESGYGMAKNGDPANIGHADYKSGNQYEGLVNTYVEKMKLANRLKYKNPELRLQAYNGLGVITPSTDQNFHGYKMQSIYGVPIPKGGLNMKQNPLYGKQIIDIKDNVLKKNSRFTELINEYYPEQIIKKQIGGIIKAQKGIKLPFDYQQFLDYSKTAPENRQPDSTWEYGNPEQYDHYGMWDALGKPKDFTTAVKNNPDWKPDQLDNMYHGFSTNPNTGVWLKSHIPGKKEIGNTAWKENLAFQLSGDKNWNPRKFNLVYDPEIKRMRYLENNK